MSTSSIILQSIINGIAVGCLYAILGVAIVIIFKGTQVLNFAQGDMMMIGAFMGWFLSKSGVPFFFALIIAIGTVALMSYLVERLVLHKMVGKPIFAVAMITIGLSSIMRGFVGLIWGHESYALEVPAFGNLEFGDVVFAGINMTIVLATVVIAVLSIAFYRYSKVGVALRATATDQDTSMLMGISTDKMFAVSWVLSGIISVVAGYALAASGALHSNMSLFGFMVFPAIILGGLDSIGGAIIGGLVLGLIQNGLGAFIEPMVGASVKDLISYGLLIVILFIKPYGFFGTHEIERV